MHILQSPDGAADGLPDYPTDRRWVEVPAGGGNRVTLALRAAANDVRWMATAPVARDASGLGVATFETWMLAGSYELVAATDARLQGRATTTYAPGGAQQVTLRVSR